MSVEIISEIIIRIANEIILPRYKNLKEEDIIAKSPGDMVTIADFETEVALTAELQKLYPSAVIGGEESIVANPGLLQDVISADQAFLIDPIDGTNNFIKGDRKFALMLAELKNNEVVNAWIYLPAYDKIAVASKGAGAFYDGKKINILPHKFDPEKMIAAAHIKRFPENLRQSAKENLIKFKVNKPAFCAGYDYLSLLQGKKDFTLYFRTLPWDHLPGSFIFQEAGGYVRNLSDKKYYTIFDHNKGLLSASCEEQWQQIRNFVFPGIY